MTGDFIWIVITCNPGSQTVHAKRRIISLSDGNVSTMPERLMHHWMKLLEKIWMITGPVDGDRELSRYDRTDSPYLLC